MKWPNDCVLRNHCHDDAYVKSVNIRHGLNPSEVKEIEISFYIPSNMNKDKIVLLFQLETPSGERFGDSMIAIIDIGIPIEESFVLDNEKSAF